jgi:hypothetical protein
MTTAFMQNFCSDRICGRQSGDYNVLCVGEVQFFVCCVWVTCDFHFDLLKLRQSSRILGDKVN